MMSSICTLSHVDVISCLLQSGQAERVSSFHKILVGRRIEQQKTSLGACANQAAEIKRTEQ